jgi:uncharacterized membrane protein
MFSRHNAPTLILASGIAVYTCLLTYVTWVQYSDFQAPTFDMGASIQIAQTILRTGLPLETANWVSSNGTQSINFFGIHFSLVRYMFAGAYWVLPSAITLLFIQALFVSLGSIPAYKLALHVLHDKRTALLVAGLYLLIPPIVMSNLYDVHEESIIPFALMSAYYFYVTKQYNKSIVFFVFMGMIQESADALIFFAALQLIAFNWADHRQLFKDHKLTKPTAITIALLVAAPVAFVLENHLFQVINPGAGFVPLAPQAYAISPLNIIKYAPQKLVYWFVLLALTGFLPLLNRKALILAVPWFVVSVFGGNPNFSVFFFQYSFLIIPVLIIGLVHGLERLRRRQTESRWALRLQIAPLYKTLPLLLIIISLLFTPFYPVLSPYLYPGPHLAQYYVLPTNSTALNQLFSMIPDNATVLASDYVFPHIVNGINSYPLLYVNNFTAGRIEPVIHLPENFTPDYIAIVPSDFNTTVKVITGFPTAYGLLGSVVLEYPVLVGFASVDNQRVVVSLYQHGYTGPPKLTADSIVR